MSSSIEEVHEEDTLMGEEEDYKDAIGAIEHSICNGSIERLRSLVQQFPDALERVRRPFHIATENGAPREVVRFLLERAPVGAGERDEFGRTALHVAKKGTSVSVIRLLLRHDPRLLFVEDWADRGFLHAAVRNGLNLKVIKLIVRRWPESVTRGDLIPLHFVGKETRLEVVQFLLNKWRESVDARDLDMNLLLFHVVSSGAALSVTLLLVSHRPRSLHESDCTGRLPLHNAAFGSTREVVEYILGECPGSIRALDKRGNLPLHSSVDPAMSEGLFSDPIRNADVRKDVVRLLVRQWPESVRRTNGAALTPLGLALKNKHQDPALLAIVGTLAKAWPDSLLDADEEGRLPLHVICSWSEPGTAALVQQFVDLRRQAIQQRDKEGKVPLHHALGLPVVNVLLNAWPDSVDAKDAKGRLPLHCALMGGCMDLVRRLVKLRPTSLREPDAHGRIPLHCAIASGREKAVGLLLEEGSDSLHVKDREGSGALHIACLHSCSKEVIQLLLQKSPELIDERDTKGRLPLHLAVARTRLSEAVLVLLFGICRHTLRVPDNDGRLPLHAAVASASDYTGTTGNVMLLIQHGPDALKVKDNCGMLPLHVAVAREYPSSRVIKELVEANPTALQVADASGRLPIHVLLSYSSSRCPSLNLIQLLVGPMPNSLQVADARGMYPLHTFLYDHNLNKVPGVRSMCQLRPLSYFECLSVVRYLVERCPQAIELADRLGRLPLHVAAARGEDTRLDLQYLVSARSDSCKHRDNDGRLPLHLALLIPRRVSWTAVKVLIETCPNSIEKRDWDGCYPVHLAAARNAPLDVLYRLARSFPLGCINQEGARWTMDDGQTPLQNRET